MVKKVKLNHVYEDYALYSVLFQKDIHVKAFEAVNAAIAVECFVKKFRSVENNLRIVETHAGRSEHETFFRRSVALPIKSYTPTDIKPMGSNVVQVDAQKDRLPSCNFVISHYMSLASLSCKKGYPDLDCLDEVCSNIYRSLDTPGAWFFNNPADGYRNGLENVEENAKEVGIYYVFPNALIRKDLGLHPLDNCELRVTSRTLYNRMTSCLETYLDKVLVMSGSKCLREYEIASPLYLRFWAETEIVDALKRAGFSDIMFFRNEIEGVYCAEVHEILSPLVKARSQQENIEGYMSTDIMAIKA